MTPVAASAIIVGFWLVCLVLYGLFLMLWRDR